MESREVVDMQSFLKDYSKVLHGKDLSSLYKKQQLQLDFANEVRLLAIGQKKEPSDWKDFFTVLLSYPDLIEINGKHLLSLFTILVREGKLIEDCERVMLHSGMEVFLQNYHKVDAHGCDPDLIQKSFQVFLSVVKESERSFLSKEWLLKFRDFYPEIVVEFA